MLVDEWLAPDSRLVGRAASSEIASLSSCGVGEFLGDDLARDAG